ncbi:hypothetical protein [Bacillus alkalicola]|uniref:Cell filamentation protein n=1 Tax=Evansella alkalicola TaxID=745819 RepID=A0ABS6JTS9_9BACI|nr:hypothetical protein [Bacillus alkalicola]MBU9721657.1 hypothetical protein [Bacillus alkalicola]
MTRKRYASYKYEDPDYLYVDPDSGVLRNEFNIKSAQELQTKEYRIVTKKLLDLFENPIHVYSMKDIQKIHQFLFEEIYHWAGENFVKLIYQKMEIRLWQCKPLLPVQNI